MQAGTAASQLLVRQPSAFSRTVDTGNAASAERKPVVSKHLPISGDSAGCLCFSVVIQLRTDCCVNLVGAGAVCARCSSCSVRHSTSGYFRDGLSVWRGSTPCLADSLVMMKAWALFVQNVLCPGALRAVRRQFAVPGIVLGCVTRCAPLALYLTQPSDRQGRSHKGRSARCY